ncbi:ankyrin repeat domain-containing protein [Candidatus Jidaibacter acanthamoebae]|nr:ankyrin repeat domain-containing protein [Candidatus Jidaibacter acanthamoeba]
MGRKKSHKSNNTTYKNREDKKEELPFANNENVKFFMLAALNGVRRKGIVSLKGSEVRGLEEIFSAEISAKLRDRGNNINGLKNLFLNFRLRNEDKKMFIRNFLLNENKIGSPCPNREAVINLLLSKGCEGNAALITKEAPLEVIRQLIRHGVNVNSITPSYYTPLHAAVESCDINKITYLLEEGVKYNYSDTTFGTALHLAIRKEIFTNNKPYYIAQFLINALKEKKFEWNTKDNDGNSVLVLAAKMRTSELVEMLCSLKEKGLNINEKDKEGRTALHIACALGDIRAAHALIEAGAGINVADNCKRTPLHYGVLRSELVRSLLKEVGINPERDEKALSNFFQMSNGQNFERPGGNVFVKKSRLIIFETGCFEEKYIKKFYSDEQIKFQISILTGSSLINACMFGHEKVVDLLLDYGANRNACNINNNTPVQIIKRDKEKGAEIDKVAANLIEKVLTRDKDRELGEEGSFAPDRGKMLWTEHIRRQKYIEYKAER